ncbi:MAG: hypothetical protein ABR992_15340 [Solirubrobacteraceae bacterium]
MLIQKRRPPTERRNGRRVRPTMALPILGACLTLAACGSSASNSTTSSASNSSSSPSTGTTTSKSQTTPTKGVQGPGSSQFAAVRSCLSKQGIALPSAPSGKSRPSGTAKPGAAGGRPGGLQLPKGISSAKYQAALKKCGAGGFTPGARGAAGGTPPGGAGTGGPPSGAGAPPGEGKATSTPPTFKVSGG